MNANSQVPEIPRNAPFSPEQIAWLNGFLAGMYSNQADASSHEEQGKPAEAKPVTILWGSQTGNTEALAKQASKRLAKSGCQPTVVDMADYDKSKLAQETLLLVMTSTYGDGDPPDNAMELHRWLHEETAPKLEKTKYSVLALGDTNYPDFCKCGIEFDNRLESLGATRLSNRVDCDVEYDEAFEQWLVAVESALAEKGEAESGSSDPADEASEADDSPAYGKKNPFPARLLVNRNLNGEGSSKETRHIEISLAGSGFSYKAGDALAVLPQNGLGYVDELIEVLKLDPAELVLAPSGDRLPLREALSRQCDVTGLGSRSVKGYASLVRNEKLDTLISDRSAFKEYAEGRQLIDLAIEYPVELDGAQSFVSILPKLAPRLYSISSSPQFREDEVHLTVGIVDYEVHGRSRKGVCSTYLRDHDGTEPVKIFFHATKSFVLPDDDSKPAIMVGPGTGIAPFRAFLQERKARGAKGKNWLFFGDQHADCDFLYQEEIESFFREGLLTRFDTAFSRDQKEKIYVQQRMEENGKEIYAWLQEGAFFYVCGDASKMAKDVDLALHTIVAREGGFSKEEAKDYVSQLKSGKRYLRDVY